MRNLRLKSDIVVISVVVTVMFSSTGLAATHRVEQDGSGEFVEIQAAVDVSAPGDTILIGPGVYSSTHTAVLSLGHEPDVCVHVKVEGLTLRGTNPNEVIIGPESYYFGNFGSVIFGVIDSGQALTSLWRIENLTLRNFWVGACVTGVVEISNCRFIDNQGSGVAGFEAGGTNIASCEFFNNGQSGINERNRDYVHISDCYFEFSSSYFDGVADLLIENCTGVRGGGSTHGGTVGLIRNVQLTNSGFGFMGGSDIVVRNSSIASPVSSAISARESSLVLVDSCVLTAPEWPVFSAENAQLTIHNSHIISETGPAVMCARYSGPDYFLDLTGNYWGTANPEEIPALIIDGNDDSSVHAFVKYAPIAGGPVSVEESSWGDLKAMFR